MSGVELCVRTPERSGRLRNRCATVDLAGVQVTWLDPTWRRGPVAVKSIFRRHSARLPQCKNVGVSCTLSIGTPEKDQCGSHGWG